MADRLVVRGAREHNLETSASTCPGTSSSCSRGCRGRASRRWRSTPSTPRASAATSSRSRPTPASSWANGQARRRLHRGAVAGHLDRPEVGQPQPAVDRRDDYRGLRLPAAALRPHRAPALPHLRPTGRRARRPSKSSTGCSSCPKGPVSRSWLRSCGGEGRVQLAARRPGQAGLRPRPGRRGPARAGRPGRGRPGAVRDPHDRGGGRPAHPAGQHPPAPDRVDRDGARADRGHGRGPRHERQGRRQGERGGRRAGDAESDEAITFSQHLACTHCGISFEEPAPRNFSFNSPYGACPVCAGLGTRFEVDPELVVPDDSLSLEEGALAPWSGARSEYFTGLQQGVADFGGFSFDTPWKKLKAKDKKLILYGTGSRAVRVRTRIASTAPAATTRTSRASSRGCSGATASPSPTGRASRSSSTSARSTARRATGRGSSPSRWP